MNGQCTAKRSLVGPTSTFVLANVPQSQTGKGRECIFTALPGRFLFGNPAKPRGERQRVGKVGGLRPERPRIAPGA